MPSPRGARGARVATALCALAIPAVAAAQVRGVVTNGTTGRPAQGVALTLSSFVGGMTPVGETVSGADGAFSFSASLPAPAEGQPFAGAIRAELDGVGYTEIVRAETDADAVRVTVYSASADGLPAPSDRVVILEPSDGTLLVRDGYIFLNDSQPPVTYSSEGGTLLFELPSEAGGTVEVSGSGPAGMPLRSTALPAGEPGLYKVDFPLKPGTNQLNLSYAVPHEDGARFTLRSVYPGLTARVAVPQGVSVAGEGLDSLGEEPTMRASVYELPDESEVDLTVSGQGRLRSGSAPAGQSDITIEPAPIAGELAWIVLLSALIFGVGFYHLLTSRLPDGGREG